MRIWSVSAFFPEVKPAHEATQSCTVTASSMAIAANFGLKEFFEREAIKHKHITIVKLSIVAAGEEKRAPSRAQRSPSKENAA